MNELITIIVPVYNTRKYLDRCITSIISQTYTALQIILVDDGSTDGSGDICDTFARQDTRIEVIHQANGGVSAARNAGLDRARGAWIAFTDSDDYVSPNYIEDLLFAARRDGCDIAICRFTNVQDDSEEVAPFKRATTSRRITGHEASLGHFGKGAVMFNSVWGKVYRAKLWEGLRFPKGKIHEDTFVSHVLLYNSEYIALSDAALYAYVHSGGSIARGKFSLRRLDLLEAWREGVRFYSAVGEPNLAHIARRVYCNRVFDAWYLCKKFLPHERETPRLLRQQAKEAYIEAKPIRGYIDCSPSKALAYRIKLFIGRWCLPFHALLFRRGRKYI